MSFYSALHRKIDERTDETLAKRYMELFGLVNGLPPRSDDPERQVDRAQSHHHVRKKKHSRDKDLSKVEDGDATPTMVSAEEKARTQSADFRKWLKKKNEEARQLKKQLRLEKIQIKMAEEHEIQEKEEKLKAGQLAFQEWLNKKSVSKKAQTSGIETTTAADNKKATGNDHRISSNFNQANDSDVNSGETFPDTSNRISVDDEKIPPVEDVHEKQGISQSNFQQSPEHTSKESLQAQIKPTNSMTPKRSKEPKISRISKAKLEEPEQSKENSDTEKTSKIENLRKKITYDEWLKVQHAKSALQKATIEQEKNEIRISLENMAKAKLSARQRVQNLLSDDYPAKNEERVKHSRPKSNDVRKKNEKPSNKSFSDFLSHSSSENPSNGPEPTELSHGKVTSSLDTTQINDDVEVFALTALTVPFEKN